MNNQETFKRVAISVPVNRTAAQVMRPGVHYSPNPAMEDWFEDQPEVVPITTYLRSEPSFVDLTGHTIGLLRVIGWAGRNASGKKSLWVCRCKCGRFALRQSKVIKANKSSPHFPQACAVCTNTARVRNGLASFLGKKEVAT